MNDTLPIPTRGLKFASALARWTLRVLLAFWLVLALSWGALHGWIVPRIAEFRPLLERQASRVLGLPVHIGQISARSEGLIPTFELEDITLSDAEGRDALILPHVVAALSPRSLWHLGFQQLYVERPELEVRRSRDGRLHVAGLAVEGAPGDGGRIADWVFSQVELVIAGGIIHWTDEQRGLDTLSLTDLNLVMRNSPRRHIARLDATPPPLWGDRFSLVAQFRQPLISVHRGRWQDWTGQIYAHFTRVDVARLRQQIDPGFEVSQGQGALRLWADVAKGQLTGAVADVALASVNVQLAPGLDPLALTSVQGRLGGHRLPGGFDFSTSGLQFLTADGLRWPGGNVFVSYTQPQPKQPGQGEFRADRMDLAALSQIAHRVPLGEATHQALARHAPQGLVQSMQARWQGPADGPEHYSVKGRVVGLSLTARDGLPGVRGLDLDFDLNQSGGRAGLQMAGGRLDLPGVFEDPVLPVDQLDAQLQWQREGDRLALKVDELRFANPDLRGEARFQWRTSDPAQSPSRSRFPGVLDLNANVSEADGTRIHRYLPLHLDADVRHYVQDAVTAGRISNAQFRIKGDLHDLPYANPKQGEFRISARVREAALNYVPKSVLPAGSAPWPALSDLQGELVFDRLGMYVKGASARFAGHPELQITRVEADIPNLMRTVVGVDANVKGPLPEVVALINGSPLSRLTHQALSQATATGGSEVKLKLSLPISQIDRSKVQGILTFTGNNDLRISPQAPALSRLRGQLAFSETGFQLNNVQGRALGGDLRLDGGMRPAPSAGPGAAGEPQVQIRATGVASAEGLRQAAELGFVAKLAEHATGSAPYTLALGFYQGQPEIQVQSSLQGLALNLPAPLAKAADTVLPLRFDNSLLRDSAANTPQRDQLLVELGRLVAVHYVRDISGPQARVLQGSLAIGLAAGESAPLPAHGVMASVQLPQLDLDAWEHVLTRAGGPVRPNPVAPASSAAEAAAQSYLPTAMAVRAGELKADGRQLHNVVLGGTRDGAMWRANLDAQELNGYLEYRPPGGTGAGRLFARLSRLKLAQSTQSEVEALLDEQPSTIPALDIVVDDFELRGKRLGRVEIEAVNRGGDTAQREWRLSKFNLITPEATLTATGNWAQVGVSRLSRSLQEHRRTVMNFRLEVRDAGDLLTRLGMPGVVRQGHGSMEGQVAWLGSPLSLDYPTLAGQINIQLESGQFLKADPGLAKLLGVLSLQALPRRLTLDFRDVFSQGFSFDLVRGDARIDQGRASTNNLQMKGVNAAVFMEGSADLARETQDLKVVVVPEVNAGTASLVATAINPAIGLGTFLAQMFLRRPLMEAATQEFHIDGSWTEPRIVKVERPAREATPPAAGALHP
ncbi:YhdP family protein [Curvibacter sp. HBC61]|uniref:YhdP family protein n=1 Tax=Curvibacter cyanobacteriorum TaxID=3026422 RepID=A0ABT5MZU1_9BURK|nr:YhdP family protein [Curvibacter sp. HBC61]MDD0839390.1 YhdP family protein [Curvibacter sp. HBC61]